MWRSDTEKELPAVLNRTPLTQVFGDSGAHVGRQRQSLLPVPFAADDDLATSPVNVAERQAGDLTAA